MEIKPGKTSSQFTFILTKKVKGRIYSLSHPTRIVLELYHTTKQFQLNNAKLAGTQVAFISSENSRPDKLRFIFKTKTKMHWRIRFLPNQDIDGTRLQLTLILSNTPHFLHSSVNTKNKFKKKYTNKPLFTIVIDAGHGGKDSGAKGPNGLEEKKVVLAIAKRLSSKINQTSSMQAILTRERDEYVSLRTRLKLARQFHADLFIAIHADAYFDHQAKGASVYALSARGATSEAARWLAERDNYSELGGIELQTLQDKSPMLRSMLIDLAQTVTIQDSLHFGNSILIALKKVTSLHYRHVEQARFVVLKSPDIPSILVETGFISHPQEEKRLADPLYQAKLADALASGILQYVKKYNTLLV
jgi:N-acetylmuramoyl-L-alanine amidase